MVTQVQSNTCAFCHQPINGVFYRIQQQIACESCSEAIRGVDELNHPTSQDVLRAALAAGATAIVGAVAWAMLSKATEQQWGLVAVALGWAVVWAAMKAGRGRRGPKMQLIVIVCSVLAIYLGKNLFYGWAIWDRLVEVREVPISEQPAMRIRMLLMGAIEYFRPFDLLWYAIVIFGGWQRTKVIPLHLEGPFDDLPKSPPPNLQFNQAVYNRPPGNT